MFEDYQPLTTVHFHSAMRKVCAGDNDIVLTVTARQEALVWHPSRPDKPISLNKQLEGDFAKCQDICAIAPPNHKTSSRSTFAVIFDCLLVVVQVEFIANTGQSNQKKQLRIAGLTRIDCATLLGETPPTAIRIIRQMDDRLYLSMTAETPQMISVLVVQIDSQSAELTVQPIQLLEPQFQQEGNPPIIDPRKLLRLIPLCEITANTLLVYSELEDTHAQSHSLFVFPLPSIQTLQKQRIYCNGLHPLPNNPTLRLLRKIAVISPQKRNKEHNPQILLALFYQAAQDLHITCIALQQSTIPVKHRVYPNTFYYNFIRSSITQEELQLRGQQFCIENLTFLLHCRQQLNGADKLTLLASPTNPSSAVLNDLPLPQQIHHLSHTPDKLYLLSKHSLSILKTLPKRTIYLHLLHHLPHPTLHKFPLLPTVILNLF